MSGELDRRGFLRLSSGALAVSAANVAVDVAHYSHDPDIIGRYRDRVAGAVEALGRSLGKSYR